MPTPPLTLDFTSILRPGVYLLRHGTRVTYVGKARCILAALTNHLIRNRTRLPAILANKIPVIHFDGLEIIPCDPQRAIVLQAALITLHNPLHNRKLTGPILDPTDSEAGLPQTATARSAPTLTIRRL